MGKRNLHIAVTITDLGTGEILHADASALVAPYLNYLKDNDEVNLYEEFDEVAGIMECENIEELREDIHNNIDKCEAALSAMKQSIDAVLKDPSLARSIVSGNVISSRKLDDDSVIIEIETGKDDAE